MHFPSVRLTSLAAALILTALLSALLLSADASALTCSAGSYPDLPLLKDRPGTLDEAIQYLIRILRAIGQMFVDIFCSIARSVGFACR